MLYAKQRAQYLIIGKNYYNLEALFPSNFHLGFPAPKRLVCRVSFQKGQVLSWLSVTIIADDYLA